MKFNVFLALLLCVMAVIKDEKIKDEDGVLMLTHKNFDKAV